MNGQPVPDQVLGPLVRQAVAGLQDQHLEHQHMIKSRPATLRAVRARHRPLEITTEQFKIHNRSQPFQGIALGREFLQALLNVEKSSLTPHPLPPSRTQLIESRTSQNSQVFGAVQSVT
jgi:hypothetical protein